MKPAAPAALRQTEFELPDVGKVTVRAMSLSSWFRLTSGKGDVNERTVQMLAASVFWEDEPLWTVEEWERYTGPDAMLASRELVGIIYDLQPEKKNSAQTSDSP